MIDSLLGILIKFILPFVKVFLKIVDITSNKTVRGKSHEKNISTSPDTCALFYKYYGNRTKL